MEGTDEPDEIMQEGARSAALGVGRQSFSQSTSIVHRLPAGITTKKGRLHSYN